MSSPLAVEAKDVTKVFRAGERRRSRAPGVVALDGVSLDVGHGEAVALIGANGAGKTTLLRLIAGVGRPDRGVIRTNGRMGTLLELNAGMHPDLTGRENAILAAVIAGLTRAEARRRLAAVAEFAGLSDVLDRPLRTFSSGMQARLAFSVAVHVDADVLLVDEVLSVGDLAFQERCADRIAELRRDGVTLLAVSHDVALAASLCERAVWLRKGKVVAAGPTKEVARQYRESVAAQTRASTPPGLPVETTRGGVHLVPHENRWGTMRAQIVDAAIDDGAGRPVRTIASGSSLRLWLRVSSPRGAPRAAVSATVIRADGTVCLDACETVDLVEGGDADIEVAFERIDLAAGSYAFDVGVYDPGFNETFDYHYAAYPFTVVGPRPGSGVMAPPARWRARSARVEEIR